ncbi:MAG: CFI-box-CTERM domain-containing protein [Candidatus Brocadiia bacterium]
MFGRFGFGLLLALTILVFFAPSANAASSWDVSENWDSGYGYGEGIYDYSSPWSSYTDNYNYPCYNTWGADVDGYYYSSASYSAHVGMPYGYYGNGYFFDYYLTYSWASPTLANGTLTFWYDAEYCSLDIEYTPDGYNWYNAASIAGYYSYVYGATASVTIPSGSLGFRFRTYAYDYYYYGLWVDDIQYVMPYIDVTAISGYDTTDINAGVLSLVATTFSVLSGVDKVEWQYKKSSDAMWSTTVTDNTPGDGFTYALNTAGITDGAFQVRARAYDDGQYGEWTVATMQVQNLSMVTLTPPSPTGGDTTMSLSYTRTKIGVWYPANKWIQTGTYYSTGTYWSVDVANSIPYSGTCTKVQTNFSNVPYTYPFKLKLFSGSAGSFTEVATSDAITPQVGLQEYTLAGSAFSNLAKNLLLGQEGEYWMFYNGYNYFQGNTQNCWYRYAYNTYWYGPYNYYVAPLRVQFQTYGADVDTVSFQYQADGGSWVSVGNNQIVKVPGQDQYTINWSSWAVDSNNVKFRARFHYGPVWSGTYNFGPYPVHNRIDLTYNIAKSPSAPGTLIPVAGTQLTIAGTSRTPPYSSNTTYYGTFTIAAPLYVADTSGMQWRFDYWSDGGAMTHEMQVLPRMNTAVTAYYARQVYFEVDSSVDDFTAPPSGYYEPGTLMQIQVPQYSLVDSGTRYRFVSMDISSLGVNTTELWYSFNLPARSVVTLNWQLEYYFSVLNDKGVGTGTATGWYSDGTTVAYSVAQTIDNGVGARFDNRGYSINSAPGAATRSYSGTLSGPTTIQWVWQQQYSVMISSNVGTTAPASGWYDSGTVLSISSTVPGSTATVSMFFNGWTGSGTGSVTTSGGNPAQSLTVNGYVTEMASWTVSYKLDLVVLSGLGSFSPNASGWYNAGTTVTINIVAPAAQAGSRYVPQWIGEGSGSFSSIPSPDSPRVISVTMNNAIRESVQWHLQYSLTIENPDGYGTQNPAVGTYWYFNGATASGVCQYIVGSKLCDGYYATGSIASGTKPYFTFDIAAPTLVRWMWKDRPTAGDQSWNISELVVNVGSPTQMAASRDTSGRPVVAYYDAIEQAINLAIRGESGWTVSTLRSGVLSLDWLDLFVDTANNPHVAYYSTQDKTLHYIGAFEVKADSGVPSDVIQTIGDSGRNPHIAANTMGDVFVAFYDVAENSLKLATLGHSSGTWDVETVDAEGNPGLFNAIAVREMDGMPVIAYHTLTLRRLMYAESTAGGWVLSVVDADGDQGFYPSVALAPDGTPMIAYQDATDSNKLHLKFATRVDNQWYSVLVDPADGSGFNTSIAVDRNGVIHIGHHDFTTLRYARFNGASWDFSALGGTNVIGNTAIVLATNGYPQIVYLDGGRISTVSAKSGTSGDGGGGDGGGTTATSGGGGCFVATAAFGSMSADAVRCLTTARDTLIAGSTTSGKLVELYYLGSPAAAATLRDRGAFRAMFRKLLAR